MQDASCRACRCPDCLAGDPWTADSHRLFNLLLERLDEDHRRWLVALESLKIGHGGDRLLSLMTGMHVKTIRRGRRELGRSLENCPPERIRRRGAGRPALKKKTRRS
jgi:hypothetical protein